MAGNKEKLVKIGTVESIAKTKERAEELAIKETAKFLSRVSDQTGKKVQAFLEDPQTGEQIEIQTFPKPNGSQKYFDFSSIPQERWNKIFNA